MIHYQKRERIRKAIIKILVLLAFMDPAPLVLSDAIAVKDPVVVPIRPEPPV